MYLLENLGDVVNVVNHSMADNYVYTWLLMHFLASDVARPLNVVIKHFIHSIEQTPALVVSLFSCMENW